MLHLYALLYQRISIHAPLAGRDVLAQRWVVRADISIHAPLAGRDTAPSPLRSAATHFNPRAPCGARPGLDFEVIPFGDISIHAPLAGRDPWTASQGGRTEISIHAPLAGRDAKVARRALGVVRFQSTRPLRGATRSRRASQC